MQNISILNKDKKRTRCNISKHLSFSHFKRKKPQRQRVQVLFYHQGRKISHATKSPGPIVPTLPECKIPKFHPTVVCGWLALPEDLHTESLATFSMVLRRLNHTHLLYLAGNLDRLINSSHNHGSPAEMRSSRTVKQTINPNQY